MSLEFGMVPEAGNVRFLGFYAETRHSGSDPIPASLETRQSFVASAS
jgi:hypothetical protein